MPQFVREHHQHQHHNLDEQIYLRVEKTGLDVTSVCGALSECHQPVTWKAQVFEEEAHLKLIGETPFCEEHARELVEHMKMVAHSVPQPIVSWFISKPI